MECPRCSGREFEVTVVLTGDVRCRFEGQDVQFLGNPVSFDSEWDPASPCRCVSCHWEGRVADASKSQQQPVPPQGAERVSEATLAEIQRELASEDCPPQLRESLQTLLAELKLLRAQVEVVQRVTRKRSDSSGDTTLL